MSGKRKVVIGVLGTVLDRRGKERIAGRSGDQRLGYVSKRI